MVVVVVAFWAIRIFEIFAYSNIRKKLKPKTKITKMQFEKREKD